MTLINKLKNIPESIKVIVSGAIIPLLLIAPIDYYRFTKYYNSSELKFSCKSARATYYRDDSFVGTVYPVLFFGHYYAAKNYLKKGKCN